MKKLTLALIITLVGLAGCAKEPMETLSTNNPNFAVQRLFEFEGCKVYRFSDGGRDRYYTNCAGSQTTTMSDYSQSCGKNCTKTDDDSVVTSYVSN